MDNQKIYASKYGQEAHTMKPQYEVRNNAVYRTIYHPDGGSSVLPDYKIVGDKMYTTANHSAGAQANPWFKIKGNEIHNTGYHPEGRKTFPTFHIK